MASFLLQAAFAETFNYYERNNVTGDFVLKNIGGFEFSDKIRYVLNEEKTAVTGCYFDSDAVKFIDELKDGKIQKSTYFSKADGIKMAEKAFLYDSQNQIKKIVSKIDAKDLKFDSVASFQKNSEGELSCNVRKNLSFDRNAEASETMIETYRFFENYLPKSLERTSFQAADGDFIRFEQNGKWTWNGCDSFRYEFWVLSSLEQNNIPTA